MDRRVGIWIDHERAVVVTLAEFGLSIVRVNSDVRPRSHQIGGARARTIYGPRDVADETSRDARYRHELERFYDRIVQTLTGADEIYICGPGAARRELHDVVKKAPQLASRIRAVSAADKMTDKQFKAHVREVFDRPLPRVRKARN